MSEIGPTGSASSFGIEFPKRSEKVMEPAQLPSECEKAMDNAIEQGRLPHDSQPNEAYELGWHERGESGIDVWVTRSISHKFLGVFYTNEPGDQQKFEAQRDGFEIIKAKILI